MKKHFLMINSYRSSTSDGFSNTWEIFECSKRDQIRALKFGLCISDTWGVDSENQRYPLKSTNGIRLATRKEIRRAKRRKKFGGYVDQLSI